MANQNKKVFRKSSDDDKKFTSKNKSNRNRKRGSSASKSKEEYSDGESFKSANKCNDIAWYAQDKQLLLDTASLPWSTQTGIIYDKHISIDSGITGDVREVTPGILAVEMMNGIGKTDLDLDAPNVAANAIYTFIRHMNSGHANYDAPDLMYYLMQMDDVFSYINWAQRLYGTIFAYNVFNRYTPDALIAAQHVDPQSLRDNIVQFRARLNMLIKQAATLVVPNNLPIYLRHSWLYSNYYIEGTDIKDQIYMYTPVAFHKLFIPSGSITPSSLVTMPWTANDGTTHHYLSRITITADEVLNRLQEMIDTMVMSEDFGIMAGDILKAYGESGVTRLSEIPEYYVTPIVPNNEVLLQIKNSVCSIGHHGIVANDEYANNIYSYITDPVTNKIKWQIDVDSTNFTQGAVDDCRADLALSDNRILTLEGSPSVEMNMIMTRCQFFNKLNVQAHPSQVTVEYFTGTELITGYSYYDLDRNANGVVYLRRYDAATILGFNDNSVAWSDATTNYILGLLAVMTKFKYHPQHLYFTHNSTAVDTSIQAMCRYYQIDNFTYVSDEELDRMNAVAIMSEFNVPHMALVK